MEKLETVWRLLVASLAVWRLSRFLLQGASRDAQPVGETTNGRIDGRIEDLMDVRFWGGRALDLLCWVSVWMSSQTAIWVAFGFAGVLLSWFTASGTSRLLLRAAGKAGIAVPSLSARPRGEAGEISCLAGGDGMRVNRG